MVYENFPHLHTLTRHKELLLPVQKFRNLYVTVSCTTQVVPSDTHIIGYILRKRRAS